MNDKRRFWVRWSSPSPDPRPMKVPAPCVWWCTGHDLDETYSIICGVVDAATEQEAHAMVLAASAWPGSEINFCNEKGRDWRPHNDRFPWPTEDVPDE